MVEPRRPLLRYHGGKWRIAPWVIAHFPRHRIYVEPYGGGASVLLRKPRSYVEVYNDLDGEIVNLFRVVRERSEELCRLVALTPYARDEFELSYLLLPGQPPRPPALDTLLDIGRWADCSFCRIDCHAEGKNALQYPHTPRSRGSRNRRCDYPRGGFAYSRQGVLKTADAGV